MTDIKPEFDGCKRPLIEQSKKEFKNKIVEINKVKERLKSSGSQAMTQGEQEEECTLKSRLHALWKMEEFFGNRDPVWKQRSRLHALWIIIQISFTKIPYLEIGEIRSFD